MIAAANILGENKKYPGSCGMNSVEFFGLPVISFGITRPDEQQGFEELAFKDEKKDVYKKVILKNNIIKGAIFVKRVENIGILLKLAKLRVDVSAIKDKLLNPDFNFAMTWDLGYEKEEFYLR